MDIMLDLETMGTGDNAAIVSIGAVKFSVVNQEIVDRFYMTVDLGSSIKYGGQVTGDTIMWWIQQSEEARAELLDNCYDILHALREFTRWIQVDKEPPDVWGNSATFDDVILANAFKNAGMVVPWPFWASRCYKTIRDRIGHGVRFERIGLQHKAVDDAESQAVHLMKILQKVS